MRCVEKWDGRETGASLQEVMVGGGCAMPVALAEGCATRCEPVDLADLCAALRAGDSARQGEDREAFDTVSCQVLLGV